MTEMIPIETALDILALIITGLLSGSLLSITILIYYSGKTFSRDDVLMGVAPGFFWMCSLLAITAAFSSAISGHAIAGFVLGIIGMSLIFSRIHLLRLAISSLAEGRLGDKGAMRMYRFNMGLLAGLLMTQILASLWILVLLSRSH